ncbi:MAG: hypothetical protein WBE79_08080 [Candidatus Cybelea sp.]|jgi:hypothetical protein
MDFFFTMLVGLIQYFNPADDTPGGMTSSIYVPTAVVAMIHTEIS